MKFEIQGHGRIADGDGDNTQYRAAPSAFWGGNHRFYPPYSKPDRMRYHAWVQFHGSSAAKVVNGKTDRWRGADSSVLVWNQPASCKISADVHTPNVYVGVHLCRRSPVGAE